MWNKCNTSQSIKKKKGVKLSLVSQQWCVLLPPPKQKSTSFVSIIFNFQGVKSHFIHKNVVFFFPPTPTPPKKTTKKRPKTSWNPLWKLVGTSSTCRLVVRWHTSPRGQGFTEPRCSGYVTRGEISDGHPRDPGEKGSLETNGVSFFGKRGGKLERQPNGWGRCLKWLRLVGPQPNTLNGLFNMRRNHARDHLQCAKTVLISWWFSFMPP